MSDETIGIIGAGHIGAQVARLAVRAGYDVVVSNTRGPDSLAELVAELGTAARAATPAEAAAAADIAIVSIPLKNHRQVPVAELRSTVVVDTANYYPDRDGFIPELEDESTTTAELLQAHLPGSFVVKGFNHIGDQELTRDAAPSGTGGRRALALAGDDSEAKHRVARFMDRIGFDTLDAGPLSQGWRYQRDTLAYHGYQTVAELAESLAGAQRYRDITEPQRTAP